jgi:hypothetical protein
LLKDLLIDEAAENLKPHDAGLLGRGFLRAAPLLDPDALIGAVEIGTGDVFSVNCCHDIGARGAVTSHKWNDEDTANEDKNRTLEGGYGEARCGELRGGT